MEAERPSELLRCLFHSFRERSHICQQPAERSKIVQISAFDAISAECIRISGMAVFISVFRVLL